MPTVFILQPICSLYSISLFFDLRPCDYRRQIGSVWREDATLIVLKIFILSLEALIRSIWRKSGVGRAFIRSIWRLLGMGETFNKVKGFFYIFFLTRG